MPVRATLTTVTAPFPERCFVLALCSSTSRALFHRPHNGSDPHVSDAPFKQRPSSRDLTCFYACTFPKWQKGIIEEHGQGYSGSTGGRGGGGGAHVCARGELGPSHHSQASLDGITYPLNQAGSAQITLSLKHRGSRVPLTETNTQQGLGPLHVGEPWRSSQAQPHLLWRVAVPMGRPYHSPTLGHQPPHLPQGEGNWSKAHLGGASTETVFQVGLAQCDVLSQATPGLRHPLPRAY